MKTKYWLYLILFISLLTSVIGYTQGVKAGYRDSEKQVDVMIVDAALARYAGYQDGLHDALTRFTVVYFYSTEITDLRKELSNDYQERVKNLEFRNYGAVDLIAKKPYSWTSDASVLKRNYSEQWKTISDNMIFVRIPKNSIASL